MADNVPDGARGVIYGVYQRADYGHIWNWEKVDGEIKFFEFQTGQGEVDVASKLRPFKAGRIRVVRLDDMTPTEEVLFVLGDPTLPG
ncbi:hypothetical protein [Corynebacterium sp.]|uniref:hypothetical protein n=1 Tax=Corynebacterium sp. TaxID=1720 RepID=UPI0026DD884E|nr:hypothetical protein [Corynebacterium sp.]MDO5032054.1 hypothetical protein [Corynebacterium sp.]